MKHIKLIVLGLTALTSNWVRAQSDPACVSIFPNPKCRSAEANPDRPIIVSNLECDYCYSSSVLQTLLTEQDFPLTDAEPSSFKELGSGYDFKVNCADETVSVYQAISKTTPRCSGQSRTYDNSTCIRIGDSSLRGVPGVCNYTIKTGFTDYPQPGDSDVCGYWGLGDDTTCGECHELWLTTPDIQYYMIDCMNGATTLYSDSECLVRNTDYDPVPISTCQYYPGEDRQSAHLQVLPTYYQENQVCRAYYSSSDCTGPITYLDCESSCGGCYQFGIVLWDSFANATYTNCDTLSTVFYSDYLCSENSRLTAPVAHRNCVTHDNGSFRTGDYWEYL